MNVAHLLGRRDTPALRAWLAPLRPEQVLVRPVPPVLRLLWPRWVAAMALPGVVWVRPEALSYEADRLARLMIHELVHAWQWETVGVVGFARSYLADYLRGRVRRLGHRRSYAAIRLEVEAREVAARFTR